VISCFHIQLVPLRLGLDVAFDEGDGTPSIVDAKLMFRTRCVSK
jgi:hypothetical protein